ncbi:MAG: glycosyltransferase family 4 protein [Candidatus Hadarchaeales archaeon]
MGEKVRLAVISTDVRRDSALPFLLFKKVDVKHFYNSAPYSDFNPKEIPQLERYRTFFDLCIKIRKYRPHIIQGSEPYGFPKTFQACAAAYLMSKILKIPMLFPMFENRPPEARFGVFAPLLKKILKIYANQAKLVLFLNEMAKKNLIEAGVPENKLKRVMWGTSGVNIKEFSPRKTGREPNFGKAILFVGLLDERKGVMYLLQAFKRVKKKIKDLKLVMIGKGPLHKKIVKFAKENGLENEIFLLGSVRNEEMPNYFRSALLTVIPSITTKKWAEQVGMANIQSMACGVPVVSTFSGAIPEYVKNGKTGILVPEKDAESLAEAIVKLLEDERLRKKLGKNARKYAIEHFDIRKNVQKCEELVLEILSGAGAGI